ncbi:WD repeat-containing protein 91 isoform X2 [Bombyx mori]|uniref:ARMC9 CTLH-like domain-containing protein n=1 Tax=Bombyx mori TaxID=7091 RepID=A0A8R2HPP0_BOMMO|nr:WD repeat-containing protein 91 isoform X2 [Bombyx mori]
MAHVQFVDELVREYLLFRGFASTLKAFDNDLKADKDKGFRVDKIIEQIMHFINVSDLNGLKEYWSHLDSLIFTKLEIHVQPAFPYIQKPEENPSFSLYFTRAWQDSVLVSLHNLLATVFQCMPQPTLTSYESDAILVKKLQDKLAAVSGKTLQQQPMDKTSPTTHQSRLSQYAERLSGTAPLVDDFCAVPSEQLDSTREARGLRSLLRMGNTPVMGRKAARSQSQN